MNPSRSPIPTSKGNVIIRPAVPTDASQFSNLRMEALRDNPTAFGSSFKTPENWSVEWALKSLSGSSLERGIFTAEFDQNLLGMAVIRRGPGHKTQHSATIGGVFVRPEWRGQRIVSGLIEACFGWAREQQVIIVKLAVVTTNQAALKAYERLGFTRYGTEPKVILHEGIYYDEYLMSREV